MEEMKARIEHRRQAIKKLENRARRPFTDTVAEVLIEPRQKYYWEYFPEKVLSFWSKVWDFGTAR